MPTDKIAEVGQVSGLTTAEQAQAIAADPSRRGGMEAAVQATVQSEVSDVLRRVRKVVGVSTHSGNKPTEMMRALQDLEVHYKSALEEKVWDIVVLKQSQNDTARKMMEAEKARIEVMQLAKTREAEWLDRERRAQEAEEKAVRLEGRVRALIQHEELSNTNANLVSELREKLKQAQQKFLSSEEELASTKLALVTLRSSHDMQMQDLKHEVETVNQTNRVLQKEVSALQLTLENRNAQLARWSGDYSRAVSDLSPAELQQIESDRTDLRNQVRGLHNELRHKEGKMAEVVGYLDMLLTVITGAASVMVRHGGGHEKLPEFLAGRCRREQHKRSREATAAAHAKQLDREAALATLRTQDLARIPGIDLDEASHAMHLDVLAGTAGDVATVLALQLGVTFPDSFYARLNTPLTSKPLGGADGLHQDTAGIKSKDSIEVSTSAIQNSLFQGEDYFPHSLLVEAMLPPATNAADETQADSVVQPRSETEDQPDLLPPSPVDLPGSRERRQRLDGRVSRSTPVFGSNSVTGAKARLGSSTTSLPSGDTSTMLAELQSIVSTSVDAAKSLASVLPVRDNTGQGCDDRSSSSQLPDLASEIVNLRNEIRDVEEVRQRDADAIKLQLSLLLEGSGEVAENTKRQLHASQTLSSMVQEIRVTQVESLPWVERGDASTHNSGDSSFRNGNFLDPRGSLSNEN